jgi:PAS domain S-box-containing protein
MNDEPAAQHASPVSEARYRGLFEDSPISLWEDDFSEVKDLLDASRDGGVTDLRRHLEDHPELVFACVAAVKILDVNQATLDLLEVDSKDALRDGLPRYFTDATIAVFREELIALAAGRTTFECESALRTATGRTLYVVANLSIAPGHEETWSRVFISLLDVTARKDMEVAWRESRREWQTLVSNLPGVIYRCRNDRHWTMEVLSEGCEAITGYPASDLLHNRRLSFHDIIHPDDREQVWQAVQGALEQRAPFQLQYRITARDGTQKWVWEQGRGIYTTVGDVVALEGYITDITPVCEAEEMAARFGHIIDESLNEIYLFDAQTLRFLRVNRGARENLGYSLEELLEMSPVDLKPEFTSETFAALIEPLRTGERQTIQFTTVHRRKDGSVYPVEVNLQLCFPKPSGAFVAIIIDITERTRAEEEARWFTAILENTPDFVAAGDTQGHHLYMNRAGRRLVGAGVDEDLSAISIATYHPPWAADLVIREAIPTATREGVWRGETALLGPSGEEIPVLQVILCHRDRQGEVEYYSTIIHDIRERKRAERELQRVNRALQAVNECMRVLVHAVDEEAFLEEVCRLMIEIGGYRLAWVGFAEHDAQQSVRPVARAGHDQGYVDGAAITWGDTERGRGPAGTAIRTGRPCVVQNLAQDAGFQPWRDEAARRGFAACISVPLRGQDGRLFGTLNVYAEEPQAFDPEEVELLTRLGDDVAYGIVTLRVQQAHRAAEEKLRILSAAVEQSPVSVIITDAGGDIEYANPKFTEVSGYPLDEVVGQNPRILKSGEMPAEAYRGLWEAITAGHNWQGEFHNKKKDGELFWERASISPIRDPEGKVTHFVAVKEDITGHKRMEEETRALEAQLRQAQKMETIGTLAGGIAHDFNNLLQAIIGYGGMGLEDTPPGSRTHRHLRHILTAAESARDLVRQILTFSRQGIVERRRVRIDRVVNEVIALARATLPATIELRHAIDPECHQILADVSQIHQVAMNLCTNAYHAMRADGGVLEVSVGNVIITPELAAAHPRLAPGPYVRLRVADTGAGIDPIHLDRIFDPFFTTKGPQEGTGLGLSVVHGIVATQGGDIVVASEPGRGTTFDVYLLPAEADAATDETAAPQESTGNEHVLYVEDDPELAGLVEEILQRLGYRVTLSGDGAAALATILATQDSFDVVITDQVMPGLTGIGLAEKLRVARPSLPIILVTAFSDAISHDRLEELGIRTLIRKPVLAGELSDAIRRVMGSRVELG